MGTPINTPLTSEIWHLTIDDLLAPVSSAPRLGGPGPFVINLSASTAPISLPMHAVAEHPGTHVYQIQRTEDRRVRYRLRLGPFETEAQAEALLPAVREIYPSALTASAEPEDLRALEAIKSKIEAQQLAAVKAAVSKAPSVPPSTAAQAAPAAWPSMQKADVAPPARGPELEPPPPPAARVKPVGAVRAPAAPEFAPARFSASAHAFVPATPAPRVTAAPGSLAEAPARPPESSIPVLSDSMAVPRTGSPARLFGSPAAPQKVHSAPPHAAQPPAAPPPAAPSVATVPLARPSVATVPLARPPVATVTVAPPPGAAPQVAAGSRVAAASRSAPPGTSANATRRVEALSARLSSLDTTQTMRPLTATELEDASALRWFAIQLCCSEQAFDPDALPNLDIFSEYRLYSVAGLEQGKLVHALRLGFFSEESHAAAVAGYLGAFYDNPLVKRISAAERARFAHQRVEARKDIGATGQHAVIEITDERVIRPKRPCSAPGESPSPPPPAASPSPPSRAR